MLDEIHPDLPQPADDCNAYTLGSIGLHNIIIACLPKGMIGLSPAATVAANIVRTFPFIKFSMMVGIGGGIPPKVRLGDVVIGTPSGLYPGVVQWNKGKMNAGGVFERTGSLDNPPRALLSAISKLETKHELRGSRMPEYLEELKRKWPNLVPKYMRSDALKDILFRADYTHNSVEEGLRHDDDDDDDDDDGNIDREPSCDLCDQSQIIPTRPREPRVHFGLIASGDQVIKDGIFRDQLKSGFNGHLLCVETEAAGLMHTFPCVVIRGICDYADSHKNKSWQEHAAAMAAALAKELLGILQVPSVQDERTARDSMNIMHKAILKQNDSIQCLTSAAEREQEERILKWLSPIDYEAQHFDFLERRQPETGEWLLNSVKYQNWVNGRGQALFCPGIPGAGKTIMAATIIDHLMVTHHSESTIGVAYIYCDFRRKSDQTVNNLLASILKQLIKHSPQRSRFIQELDISVRPTSAKMFVNLRQVIGLYSKVFVVVDALDECEAAGGCRARFMAYIKDLQVKCGINLLATSRFIFEITQTFTGDPSIEIRAALVDINKYVEGHLDRLPKFVRGNSTLKGDIKKGISEAADGMFLLAQLHLDSLVGKSSLKSLRSALSKLSTGSQAYDLAYDNAMARIEGQMEEQEELAKQTLALIFHAKTPLNVEQLQHALATELHESTFDTENLSQIEDIIDVCAGLLTVNEENKTVRLVHYTTQEYFERTHARWFPEANNKIVSICTTYLSFEVFESGPCLTDDMFEDRLRTYPFYDYASRHWGHHAYLNSTLQDICCFLDRTPQLEASNQALQVLDQVPRYPNYSRDIPQGITGLHLAGYFGLSDLAVHLEMKYKIDVRDTYGRTPLWYASSTGQEPTVALLLGKGADYEVKDQFGKAPLACAAHLGSETVTEQLVEIGADIDTVDYLEQTPLAFAAWNGHQSVVERLCHHNANTEIADTRHGQTPLLGAATNGHLSVVQTLLKNGADYESKDKYGRSALLVAAWSGFDDIVRLLLSHGADPTSSDDIGRSVLFYMVTTEHVSVLERLLDDDRLDVNIRDRYGSTPLSVAICHNKLSMVEILLANPGTCPETEDRFGRSALWWAKRKGLSGLEKLLCSTANARDEPPVVLEKPGKRVRCTYRDSMNENGRKQSASLIIMRLVIFK
ncbi:ankyrin repeat [Fusarium pseudoanthophilum]|uniref:Ankyrin repeat n=1 Tax=Fusarium pseudoanthophilum TaxID=48495 RepID=A0A8H5NN35_9HYPO|nr:ankyrin repeat [Fusarium pseudoanthophilum]